MSLSYLIISSLKECNPRNKFGRPSSIVNYDSIRFDLLPLRGQLIKSAWLVRGHCPLIKFKSGSCSNDDSRSRLNPQKDVEFAFIRNRIIRRSRPREMCTAEIRMTPRSLGDHSFVQSADRRTSNISMTYFFFRHCRTHWEPIHTVISEIQ